MQVTHARLIENIGIGMYYKHQVETRCLVSYHVSNVLEFVLRRSRRLMTPTLVVKQSTLDRNQGAVLLSHAVYAYLGT